MRVSSSSRTRTTTSTSLTEDQTTSPLSLSGRVVVKDALTPSRSIVETWTLSISSSTACGAAMRTVEGATSMPSR